MRLRVLGAFGGEAPGGRHASAFLLDERTLIDAGSAASSLSVEEQAKLDRVLVSHSHLDHVASLAYLTETRAVLGGEPLSVCSLAPVLANLRRSFFNNLLWPDFAAIPPANPVLRYEALPPAVERTLGELRVTAVPVDHTVDAAGFLVRDGRSGFVYSGDTGPTEELWNEMRRHADVGWALVECSYPNRMEGLARRAGHLTPGLLERELLKLPSHARVLVFHIKPQLFDETVRELGRMSADRVAVAEQGRTYDI